MSQARSDEHARDSQFWAVWVPVDPAANPLVIAGAFGQISFALVEQVGAMSATSHVWTLHGLPRTGRYMRSEDTMPLATIQARFLGDVHLDPATGRFDEAQAQDIRWRGSLLQLLAAGEYSVVCHAGLARRGSVLRLGTDFFFAELPQGGDQARVAEARLSFADLLLPGRAHDGSVTHGIRVMNDITADHRAQMLQYAQQRNIAANGPAYVMRFPLVAPPNPAPANAALGNAPAPQGPVQQYAPPPFAIGASLDGPGTQWVVSMTIGGQLFLDHATVERQHPDSVTVISGDQRDQRLAWPAPATTSDGSPISVTVHSGPTRPGGPSASLGYDQLQQRAGINKSVLTTWPWLYEPDPLLWEKAIWDIALFLNTTFRIAVDDRESLVAVHRDNLLTWCRRALAVDWRADSLLKQEGITALRKLRLANLARRGISTVGLSAETDVPHDDIDKAEERHARERDAERTNIY